MNKKILIGSIITVVILVLIPTTSSVNYQDNKQKENILVDSINEIISFINCMCYVEYTQAHVGIYRNVEFSEVYEGWMLLRILLSNPFQLKLILLKFPYRINVPLFIGFVRQTPDSGLFIASGIALGNINWWE